MTREELEALMAIEGKYLYIRLLNYKKEPKLWAAIVWVWQEKTRSSGLLLGASRIMCLPQVEIDGRFMAPIHATDWHITNHKAVKKIIQEYEQGLI